MLAEIVIVGISYSTIFSYGISYDASYELDLTKYSKSNIYMFDHMINLYILKRLEAFQTVLNILLILIQIKVIN